MTSTNFVSGFGDGNKPSSKVLRPPGGGSSDIFGSEGAGATPRSVRNHMASNIFGSNTDTIVKNSGDSARRAQKSTDSYSRLFGEPERPFTPAKNHMKSSIPIGAANSPDKTDSSNNIPKTTTNGSSSQVNGHEKNGKVENGDQQNNVTKTDPQESFLNNADGPTPTPRTTLHSEQNGTTNGQRIEMPKTNGTTDISNGNDTTAVNGVNSPTITNKLKPVEINGNIGENSSTNSSTIPSSAVSPAPSHASNISNNMKLNSTRSPRFPSRNPVTGMGIEIPDHRPRRMGNHRDGNPVTGEGYKPAGAEINTTIPCLNGANQVINKNRIPPGGYSSGLW